MGTRVPAACQWYNAIKAPHKYAVQESDTTMLPKAASLFAK